MSEWGLPMGWRRYACDVCGTEQNLNTNHTGTCMAYCKGCSWKSEGFNNDERTARLFGVIHRRHHYIGEAVWASERSTAP